MKTLVTYDSAYGNTARIADAINTSLDEHATSSIKHIEEVTEDDTKGVDLIVIGSPTQGGRPTKPTQEFIDGLAAELRGNTRLAMFDTRFDPSEQNFALRILMGTIGYAATKMVQSAKQNGWTVIAEPMGFIVTDKKGPLRKGELERAASWAMQLILSSG